MASILDSSDTTGQDTRTTAYGACHHDCPDSCGWIAAARTAGARIIVIDPIRTITADEADQFIQPLPGTDVALMLSMMHVIIVGGIGIANVMSISVMQRSTEIGIRRALGHTRRTIAQQFLLEAMVVGFIGGILGVMLGAFAILVGVWLSGWVFVLQTWIPPAGVLLAIVVSIVAGLYPARRAAKLEPLETLRLG